MSGATHHGISSDVGALLPDLRELRHDLHAHPELGFELQRTAGIVAERLRQLGLEPKEGVGRSGVTAMIAPDKPGPVVALRADMDALPITEETGLPYASQVSGRMHACGHDGHTTILLGAAAVLSERPELLPGPVKLIFQPAEEGVEGAAAMIADGALENPRPDAAFALHGWPGIGLGVIGIRPGPIMASSDRFDAVITGKGGHAAHPEGTIDPIVVAAHVITVWQTIVSRQIRATDPAVVSVTRVDAGTSYNIIPPEVRLSGTYRALSAETRLAIPKKLRELGEGVCKAFGAKLDLTARPGTGVTVNDVGLAGYVADVAREAFGEDCLQIADAPAMGAEDFGQIAEKVPGVMFWLGVGDGPFCHSPAFDFPDDAIPLGVEMFVRLVRGFRGVP
jgi:amidohydrolase